MALGGAANSCGSITNLKEAVRAIKRGSQGRALVYVDGVHYAPHRLIDVQARVLSTIQRYEVFRQYNSLDMLAH